MTAVAADMLPSAAVAPSPLCVERWKHPSV